MTKIRNPTIRLFGSLKKYFETITKVVIFGYFISTFLTQSFVITSSSMHETILTGDYILVNKVLRLDSNSSIDDFIFPVRKVKRGMIVVFKAPDGLNSKYVKRIIGLPGEKVKIINKMVYINGIPIDEDYLHFEDENCIEDSYRDNFPEVAIPEYHYFCLGDNRDKSFDSRLWGLVHADYFIGIPWRIYWSRDLSVAADPFVSFFSTIRWERIFKKAE